MNPALARALAAAHVHRDEARFQAVIREIMVNERDPVEIDKWRGFLRRQEEAKAKPKAATLADGKLTLVDPVDLESVTLTEQQKTTLRAWLREMLWREALDVRGIPTRCSALFHGATGTGKTMLASAVAKSVDLPCYSMRAAQTIGSHIGETGSNLGRILSVVRATPMVLVCDEIDSLATVRRNADQVGDVENARTTNTLIQELDRGLGQSIFVATTNLPGLVDSAVRRRFAFSIEFTPPTTADVCAFMSKVAARYGLERTYFEGPSSYAEAEHHALNDVRDHVIAELENRQ